MPQLERPGKEGSESRLRLQTAVRLRWFGVAGQLATASYVRFVLGFQFDIGICLALIAVSAWLNVFLRMRYPMRTRLSVAFATALLAYDIVQLAALQGNGDNRVFDLDLHETIANAIDLRAQRRGAALGHSDHLPFFVRLTINHGE